MTKSRKKSPPSASRSRRDNFIQTKKSGNPMLAAVTKESALERRLRADQKRGALGSEGEAVLPIFFHKIQTNV